MIARRSLLLAGIGLGIGLSRFDRAFAQATAATKRSIRGTIASFRGGHLAVRQAGGSETTLLMTETSQVVTMQRATLRAVRQGEFVGIAANGPSDHLIAREVTVFPASMRGAGEGHFPWDLGEQSTMTNGTISAMVAGKDAHTLTVAYKGGQSTILVPPGTPIVRIAPGKRTSLRKGAKVFARVTQAPDGTLTADFVVVGLRGLTPPV
ncbi:MAG TPA: hypothetical protein VFA03_17285 [Acetobacteraceae bacterium]|nr:hypothetical protein [Acetobacteraceae bacterium]